MFPFSLPWFSSSTKRYRKTASFSSAGCFSLALSHNGENLAGIKLLNILTQRNSLYRYTLSETLCYGTSLGYIVFLRTHPADQKQFHEICARRLGSGFEITCITWDSASAESTCQIALGTCDNIVQVLVLGANSQLQSVFAGQLDSTVPRSIAFGDTGSIYVFGLYDGNVIGTVLSEHRCQSVIGSAAVHLKRGLFVVDNATDGFTLYRLESVDPPTVPVPKQVSFGEDGKVVIGGSDNGSVYVFNRRTGVLIETLSHTAATLIPTIAVRDVGGRCIIACASLAGGRKKAVINVWLHDYDVWKTHRTNSWTWVRSLITFVFSVSVVVALGSQIPINAKLDIWMMTCKKLIVNSLENDVERLTGLTKQILRMVEDKRDRDIGGADQGERTGVLCTAAQAYGGEQAAPPIIYL
ncbi:hypothetical protein BKA83DRAFT_4365405 [Pisolithus microcarpus]|nr:hypothetical protein BKA83DRAFT_4365405 [Pisolithus microcarpus]